MQGRLPVAMLRLASLLLLWAASTPGQAAATHEQWGNLKPGPYAVGFRHIQKYDYSRQIKPAVDFAGAPAGQTAYPVQIGLWYPARKPARGLPLAYEDLQLLALQRENFKPVSVADRVSVRNDVRSFARVPEFRVTLTDEDVEKILHTRTAAYPDALPAAGRFPVVLGGGYTITSASVLCEYLASYGYVVLFASTSIEVSTWQGTQPQKALNDRVRAYEFLTAEARTLPFADASKLAVLGLNYDGMTALLYQMENMRANAVISINGWETIRPNNGQILASLYLNRLKMRVPYLNFHWDQPNAQPADLGLVDSLKYSQRYHFIVDGLDHAGLIGNVMALPYAGAKRKAGNEYLFRSVQNFLDRCLKGSAEAERFLRNTPQANGFADVALKTQWQQAALPAAPYDTEFASILWGQKDVARAARVFREARAVNPQVQLFGENELDVYAFRYRQEGRQADELAIRQLVAEAYPRSFAATINLGIAFHASGQGDQALQAFDQAMAQGPPADYPNRGAAYFNLGCGYALAGGKDQAFAALEKAIAEGFRNRRSYETDEDLASLRPDPRFQQLLERLPKP